ncbi:MAG TPA: DNA (cytosine-5-)-methyltransferase [Synergistaceae bacterium]|nr:DNA (cytosine-5-)-methyltransferase [Synergistaceae bacterium]
MRMIDLFAGIGGFSLAAHWMGWETAAFVEWDKHAQKVLKKNFPGVPVFGDIREFNGKDYEGSIDIICGGFPCQPFSTAGKRQGTADDRYLWPEMLRIIREVKPTWVVGENVAGILSMDGGAVFEEICTSLENEGYTVESFVLPAISVGAPHRRDRIWIIAHLESKRKRMRVEREQGKGQTQQPGIRVKPKIRGPVVANADRFNDATRLDGGRNTSSPSGSKGENQQSNGWGSDWERVWAEFSERDWDTSNATSRRRDKGQGWPEWTNSNNRQSHRGQWNIHWYEAATRLCGMAHGLPAWVDAHRGRRLKQLGNSIVPQVVYQIFKAIEEYEKTLNRPRRH